MNNFYSSILEELADRKDIKMRKKLAIIVTSMRGGGAERVIVNIINKLDKNKFDIRLVLITKEGPYLDLLPSHISVSDLHSKRVRNSVFKLIKEINNFGPDIILSTLGHLNLAILAIKKLLKGNPKIIVREANIPSKYISELPVIKRKLFFLLVQKLYPKADLIIAQCEDMKEELIKLFKINEKLIRTIYNPLDIQKIRKDIEGENPFDDNKINILSVGRLTYQKGFDLLIDAFKIVNDTLSNTHLTILGDGNMKNELIEQVERLGISDKVSFLGFKNNPFPYYYFAETYVLSSRWEGFPNSLLEALACGTKVVATDCKSGPREIIGDNEYGHLVEEGNYISLANGIIKSINEENKTRDRGNYFNIDNIISDYEKALLSKY